MKSNNEMEINIETWFERIRTNKINPSILFYIGEMGSGKKTKLLELTHKFKYTISHMNWLHEKNHSSIKKKTFVQDLKHIITNRNIEFFLTGNKDIVFIHNTHIINDKGLFDEIIKMNLEYAHKIVTPVIFIINQSFVSERLLSHMTKSSYICYHKNPTLEEMKKIANDIFKKHNVKLEEENEDEIEEIIINSNLNIYSLITQINNYIITGQFTFFPKVTKKVDKNIVLKCFEGLCSDGKWSDKYKFIKPHESLMRLLMPNHISKGLDHEKNISMKEKLLKSETCIRSLQSSENLIGKNLPSYSSLLQCIRPTLIVPIISIKTMILSNCQSTTSSSTLGRILYPHSNEQYTIILKLIAKAIELEQSKSKQVDSIEWNKWLPGISKSHLNELQQLHLKIFKEHIITKKMVNKFVLRMSKYIPNS